MPGCVISVQHALKRPSRDRLSAVDYQRHQQSDLQRLLLINNLVQMTHGKVLTQNSEFSTKILTFLTGGLLTLVLYLTVTVVLARVLRSPADLTLRCRFNYVQPAEAESSAEIANRLSDINENLAHVLEGHLDTLKDSVAEATWFLSTKDTSWDMPENFSIPLFYIGKSDVRIGVNFWSHLIILVFHSQREIYDDNQRFFYMSKGLVAHLNDHLMGHRGIARDHLELLMYTLLRFHCAFQIVINQKTVGRDPPDYVNWTPLQCKEFEQRFVSSIINTFSLTIAKEIYAGAMQYLEHFRYSIYGTVPRR